MASATVGVVVVTASGPPKLPLKIGLHDVFDLPESAGDCFDSEAVEKIDCPGPHASGDDHIRLLGMDDIRIWQEALKDYLRKRRAS